MKPAKSGAGLQGVTTRQRHETGAAFAKAGRVLARYEWLGFETSRWIGSNREKARLRACVKSSTMHWPLASASTFNALAIYPTTEIACVTIGASRDNTLLNPGEGRIHVRIACSNIISASQ